jgi:hypothetical protein
MKINVKGKTPKQKANLAAKLIALAIIQSKSQAKPQPYTEQPNSKHGKE